MRPLWSLLHPSAKVKFLVFLMREMLYFSDMLRFSPCTVCVKVMDDVRATLSKEDSRNKPKIEAAMGDYCAGGTLGSREKKICYYIDPVKRDIAQPFSLGMESIKLCKRISKSNPEICSVKYPIKTDNMEKKDLSKLRVKQLKQILADRGVTCKGCIEKEEFIKKVEETEHLASDEF
jgi:mesencephalic astrocyte-derived neurotrophic factor